MTKETTTKRTKTATIATAILTIFLTATATAQPEQPQTQQATPTTIINQVYNKEDIRELKELIQQLTEEQQKLVDTTDEVPEPEWIKQLKWYSSSIVAIFTALIAAFGIFLGIFTMRYKKEAQDILSEMKKLKADAEKTKTKLDEITAETVAKDPTRAKEIAADSKKSDNPIDNAIAEAVKYQTKQQYDKAREKWQAIANLTEGEDDEIAARAYFSVAYLLYEESGNKDTTVDNNTLYDVISLYDKTLEISPGRVEALNNRGCVKSKMGDHKGAINDFNKILKNDPDDTAALNNRGLAKSKMGNYQGAIEDFNKALKNDPSNAHYHYNRGLAKLLSGDREGAKEDIEKLLATELDDDDLKVIEEDIEEALTIIEPDDEATRQLLAEIEEKLKGDE